MASDKTVAESVGMQVSFTGAGEVVVNAVEYARLKAQLAEAQATIAALQWTPITPDNLPKPLVHEVLDPVRGFVGTVFASWPYEQFFIFLSSVASCSPFFELALLGRVITGIGTGLSFPVILKLVALYAPGGRIGAYQAFFGGCFSLGSIISYIAIPRLIAFGWQRIYIMPGLFSLLLLAMAPLLRLQPEAAGKYLPINLS